MASPLFYLMNQRKIKSYLNKVILVFKTENIFQVYFILFL